MYLKPFQNRNVNTRCNAKNVRTLESFINLFFFYVHIAHTFCKLSFHHVKNKSQLQLCRLLAVELQLSLACTV